GDFGFSQATDANNNSVFAVTAANVTLNLGDGGTSLVSVTNGSATLLLSAKGLVGQVGATVSLAAGTGVSLGGTFNLLLNTTTDAVDTTLRPDNIPIKVPAGPYLRVSGTNVMLQVAGQTLTGDFSFERTSTPGGTPVVTVTFANVGLVLGGGVVTVSKANGVFVLTSAGLAGSTAAT